MTAKLLTTLIAVFLHVELVILDRVIDGDTYVVRSLPSKGGKRRTVRLPGVDCPEKIHNVRCHERATMFATCSDEVRRGRALQAGLRVLEGRHVILMDTGKCDFYRRSLAYLYVGRHDLGLRLLQLGACQDVSDRYPHPDAAFYRAYGHVLGEKLTLPGVAPIYRPR